MTLGSPTLKIRVGLRRLGLKTTLNESQLRSPGSSGVRRKSTRSSTGFYLLLKTASGSGQLVPNGVARPNDAQRQPC